MASQRMYRIEDEPSPGTLARFAVSPFWPLLGLMMGGLWLGMPWFVLNSIAVGSPNRVKEFIWVGVGVVGTLIISLILIQLVQSGFFADKTQVQYALLVLVAWKLFVGYMLYTLQDATLALYQYYGGVLNRFAPLVALGGAFLLKGIVINLVPATLWYLVVS
jgi:hypothetical protein